MPAKTTGGASAAAKQSTPKKFELPALDFKFASLTEGTNIPAPLPSPVEEEAPAQPEAPSAEANTKNEKTEKLAGEGKKAANGSSEGQEQKINVQTNGTGTANSGRPPSCSNTSVLDEKKAKRSSGWFRRLRPGSASDNTSKRASVIYQEATPKPAGPPPPMIPELNALSPKLDIGSEGSLGGSDLFKNIK
ncbi:hypothetical protein VUR80DRAFT_6393 [Thermomyces stellatus]